MMTSFSQAMSEIGRESARLLEGLSPKTDGYSAEISPGHGMLASTCLSAALQVWLHLRQEECRQEQYEASHRHGAAAADHLYANLGKLFESISATTNAEDMERSVYLVRGRFGDDLRVNATVRTPFGDGIVRRVFDDKTVLVELPEKSQPPGNQQQG